MGQDTGNRLITAIQKQTEKVTYFCTAENVSPNVAVHEIRKCYKRIRALLKFCISSPNEFSIFKENIRNSGKILAPVRESFVNIQIFDRISTGNTFIQERKLKTAKDLLLEKNRMYIENLSAENGEFKNILKLIQEFDSHLKEMVSERPSQKQIYQELCNSYSSGYNMYNRDENNSDGNELHKMRKKLKRLWYQLEFVRFMHPRYFRMKSDQLNKISEHLGEDHDLYLFLYEMKSDDFDFESDEIIIIENFVEHQRELNRVKMNPRLKQFFNEYPEGFNLKMQKIFRLI